jgi:hypothetical protein
VQKDAHLETLMPTLHALVLIFMVLQQVSFASNNIKCHNFVNMTVGDACQKSWKHIQPQLHPTQPLLGYSWVVYKATTLLTSSSKAQKVLDRKPVPVCKGPGLGLWLLDHHHLLSALDYSGYHNVDVTVSIVCDFSNLTSLAAFWHHLEVQQLSYLRTRPNATALPSLPFDWAQMPATLSFRAQTDRQYQTGMINDPWRSLVGFSRKISSEPGKKCNQSNPYCNRAFVKVCNPNDRGTPYFEFRWSYFFNDAFLQGEDGPLWSGLPNYQPFKQQFVRFLSSSSPATVSNTTLWKAAAPLLVPLSRSRQAGNYSVPSSQEGCRGMLPGHVFGTVPIPMPDPTCGLPVCSDFPPSDLEEAETEAEGKR